MKVIADDHHLAFISDINAAIAKALETVYQTAKHGIFIHHLLNNVVTYYHGKWLVGMVAKASKVYRIAEFEKTLLMCVISVWQLENTKGMLMYKNGLDVNSLDIDMI